MLSTHRLLSKGKERAFWADVSSLPIQPDHVQKAGRPKSNAYYPTNFFVDICLEVLSLSANGAITNFFWLDAM